MNEPFPKIEEQPKTQTEILQQVIDSAFSFSPENEEGAESQTEDTWLGRFGNDLAGIQFFFTSMPKNQDASQMFNEEEKSIISQRLENMISSINQLKSEKYTTQSRSIYKKKNTKVREVPPKIRAELTEQLKNLLVF